MESQPIAEQEITNFAINFSTNLKKRTGANVAKQIEVENESSSSKSSIKDYNIKLTKPEEPIEHHSEIESKGPKLEVKPKSNKRPFLIFSGTAVAVMMLFLILRLI